MSNGDRVRGPSPQEAAQPLGLLGGGRSDGCAGCDMFSGLVTRRTDLRRLRGRAAARCSPGRAEPTRLVFLPVADPRSGTRICRRELVRRPQRSSGRIAYDSASWLRSDAQRRARSAMGRVKPRGGRRRSAACSPRVFHRCFAPTDASHLAVLSFAFDPLPAGARGRGTLGNDSRHARHAR